MWFAAISLVVACAGIGYVFHVMYKYKQLIRKGAIAASSRSARIQPRETTPMRRGMGAQSDFISETFVPSETHRVEQLKMARTLIAAGVDPALAAARMGISVDLLDEK